MEVHQVKRAKADNIWECYIDDTYRILFEPFAEIIRLWRCGHHKIVDRVHLYSFSPHTQFHRDEITQADEAQEIEETGFQVPVEWLTPRQDREPDNFFAEFPAAHLRILGVPVDRIKAVRSLLYLEDLSQIPNLPAQTVGWMLDLATNPQLNEIVFDPSKLLYRATLDQLEGYSQGKIKHLMLNLSPGQEHLVGLNRKGPMLVRGSAGSGKTTIAIYRAIRHLQEGKRVLFLTYNRTLAQAARQLIRELIGEIPEQLKVIHLDQYQVDLLRYRVSIAKSDDINRCLNPAIGDLEEMGQDVPFPRSYIQEEISRVIKGNGLESFEEYCDLPRHGRKFPMPVSKRGFIWKIYQAYESELRSNGLIDWQDLPRLLSDQLIERPLDEPFDYVIIDEVQDMTPMQLRVAGMFLKKGAQGSIFMVGDVAQTLYGRGFSWKQAGLALRGRTFTIKKNFRNTRQIADAAQALLAKNDHLRQSPDYIDPESTERMGAKPIQVICKQSNQEPGTVRELILSLVDGVSFRLSDFAILCPTLSATRTYQEILNLASIPCRVHTEGTFDILEEQIKILTIHSAKGLEFPVVMLVGLHQGLLPRFTNGLDGEEAEIDMERQRTLMYVGMTRAAEALYLVTSEQEPSEFLSEIQEQIQVTSQIGTK